MTELCEWSAIRDEPSDGRNQCPNEATVCVGANGLYHLCERHAARPQFRRFSKRPLRSPIPESEQGYGLGYNQPRGSG